MDGVESEYEESVTMEELKASLTEVDCLARLTEASWFLSKHLESFEVANCSRYLVIGEAKAGGK